MQVTMEQQHLGANIIDDIWEKQAEVKFPVVEIMP